MLQKVNERETHLNLTQPPSASPIYQQQNIDKGWGVRHIKIANKTSISETPPYVKSETLLLQHLIRVSFFRPPK